MIAVRNPQSPTERERQLTEALREFDPDADVRIEEDGQLSVSTVLDEMEVIAILGGLGLDAVPKRGSDDDGVRSEVCGCGCGCG